MRTIFARKILRLHAAKTGAGNVINYDITLYLFLKYKSEEKESVPITRES